MKRSILVTLAAFFSFSSYAQVDLGEFTMSNNTNPAFLLLEETPTAIYIPENVKSLVIHAIDNFGKSLSVEFNPYFFINTKNKNRTYYKYMGLSDIDSDNPKQNPFSGINTTTVSLGFVDKEFSGIGPDAKKTYSIGLRTTLLRFYEKEKTITTSKNIAYILQDIQVPQAILMTGNKDSIRAAYDREAVKVQTKKLELYQKPIKPIFRVDGAIAYSTLFKDNTISSGTAKRFGSWLTAEGSLLLNEGAETKHNNHLNVLLTARYIEDGFNLIQSESEARSTEYFNTFYRDFGGKVEFEFGKLTFSYEYISRNGTINSERSVGNIKFIINKDISITGGFGKDFPLEDNLITIFGVNWGLNLGKGTL